MKRLTEGKDFTFNEQGLMVFTKEYHLQRGQCCGNGCLNCPFNFVNVKEPLRTELRIKSRAIRKG